MFIFEISYPPKDIINSIFLVKAWLFLEINKNYFFKKIIIFITYIVTPK
jgi:hypothetical protein